ncbi:hypothetical protein PR048_020177 [Dryococelus australis]|uniref:PiggyBac transposable element-derived protein domain-containing protein n=1 Tax=Dryococelus australis TaxID=614101 RepID=A0ABQ9H5J8_9NEOP|nr:hypothetical protein PR048_020177 [Dryococelus australis]
MKGDLTKCILRKIRGFQLWHGGTTIWCTRYLMNMKCSEFSMLTGTAETKRIHLQVTQPKVIHKYNKFMGGVDLLDNNISDDRIGIYGKKLYIPIAFWMFDVCMTNEWMLARSKELTLDQLSFRR